MFLPTLIRLAMLIMPPTPKTTMRLSLLTASRNEPAPESLCPSLSHHSPTSSAPRRGNSREGCHTVYGSVAPANRIPTKTLCAWEGKEGRGKLGRGASCHNVRQHHDARIISTQPQLRNQSRFRFLVRYIPRRGVSFSVCGFHPVFHPGVHPASHTTTKLAGISYVELFALHTTLGAY